MNIICVKLYVFVYNIKKVLVNGFLWNPKTVMKLDQTKRRIRLKRALFNKIFSNDYYYIVQTAFKRYKGSTCPAKQHRRNIRVQYNHSIN